MKLKLITASLLLAALPLTAQADQAAERALQLNQEALSAVSTTRDTAPQAVSPEASSDGGGSEAMAQARLRLNAHAQPTHIAVNGDATRLASQATNG